MSVYRGMTAFDLVFELVPEQLKREAIWMCRADHHTRGTTVSFDGNRDGLNYWRFDNGDVVRLKRNTPLFLSDEEHHRIEESLKWWHRNKWEDMVENHRMQRMLADV